MSLRILFSIGKAAVIQEVFEAFRENVYVVGDFALLKRVAPFQIIVD